MGHLDQTWLMTSLQPRLMHRWTPRALILSLHRQYYSGLGKGEKPEPLKYSKFPVPINAGGVRLVIFRLAEAAELASLADQATQEVFKAMPAGQPPRGLIRFRCPKYSSAYMQDNSAGKSALM